MELQQCIHMTLPTYTCSTNAVAQNIHKNLEQYISIIKEYHETHRKLLEPMYVRQGIAMCDDLWQLWISYKWHTQGFHWWVLMDHLMHTPMFLQMWNLTGTFHTTSTWSTHALSQQCQNIYHSKKGLAYTSMHPSTGDATCTTTLLMDKPTPCTASRPKRSGQSMKIPTHLIQ